MCLRSGDAHFVGVDKSLSMDSMIRETAGNLVDGDSMRTRSQSDEGFHGLVAKLDVYPVFSQRWGAMCFRHFSPSWLEK